MSSLILPRNLITTKTPTRIGVSKAFSFPATVGSVRAGGSTGSIAAMVVDPGRPATGCEGNGSGCLTFVRVSPRQSASVRVDRHRTPYPTDHAFMHIGP